MASNKRINAALDEFNSYFAQAYSDCIKPSERIAMSAALDAADAVASEWRPIEDADWYASVDYWREVYLPPINCTHACIRLIEPNQAIRASHDATHWRPHVAPGVAA